MTEVFRDGSQARLGPGVQSRDPKDLDSLIRVGLNSAVAPSYQALVVTMEQS